MKLLILLAALSAPVNPDSPVRSPAAPAPTAPSTRTGTQRPAPPKDNEVVRPRGTRASPLGVIGGKHDLSTSGPGPFKSDLESNACAFCHVPHGGDRTNARPFSAA